MTMLHNVLVLPFSNSGEMLQGESTLWPVKGGLGAEGKRVRNA